MQYPLRAADRPYLAHGLAEVKYKPQNKKLQVGGGGALSGVGREEGKEM